MSGALSLPREPLANGKGDAFIGRTTSILMPDGTEVVIMCRTDHQLTKVVTALGFKGLLIPSKIVNGALVNAKHVDFMEGL